MLANFDMLVIRAMHHQQQTLVAKLGEELWTTILKTLKKDHAADAGRAKFKAAWTAWLGSGYAEDVLDGAKKRGSKGIHYRAGDVGDEEAEDDPEDCGFTIECSGPARSQDGL